MPELLLGAIFNDCNDSNVCDHQTYLSLLRLWPSKMFGEET